MARIVRYGDILINLDELQHCDASTPGKVTMTFSGPLTVVFQGPAAKQSIAMIEKLLNKGEFIDLGKPETGA